LRGVFRPDAEVERSVSAAMSASRPRPRFAQQGGRLARVFAFALTLLTLGSGAARAQDTIYDTITLTAAIALETSGIISTAIRDNSISQVNVNSATLLDGSFVAGVGISQMNQDAGVATNQANLVLITLGQGTGDWFQSISINTRQDVTGNTLVVEGGSRSNTIQNSFANAGGLVQINQNSGALNQQLNVAVVNIGSFVGTGAVGLSDGSLSGYAANNQLTYNNAGPRSDIIDGSFSGFRGVAQISQSSGDGNAVTNATVIGVTVLNLQ